MALKWTQSESVGIKKIDSQHKQLINLINSLYQIINTLKTKNELESIIKELIEYAEVHFETEEHLFVKYDYPRKERHIKKHQEFKEYILGQYQKYKNKEIKISFELVDSLEDWWLDHIPNEDLDYAKYFKSLDNFKE